MSTTGPAPDRPAQPRWVVLALSAGLSLLIAGVLLLLLDLAGVDRLAQVGIVVVVLLAAVAGGSLARWLLPKLPAVRR